MPWRDSIPNNMVLERGNYMISVLVTITCSQCRAMDNFAVELVPWERQNYAPLERQIWMQVVARGWTMVSVRLDGDLLPNVDRTICARCAAKRWKENNDE